MAQIAAALDRAHRAGIVDASGKQLVYAEGAGVADAQLVIVDGSGKTEGAAWGRAFAF